MCLLVVRVSYFLMHIARDNYIKFISSKFHNKRFWNIYIYIVVVVVVVVVDDMMMMMMLMMMMMMMMMMSGVFCVYIHAVFV